MGSYATRGRRTLHFDDRTVLGGLPRDGSFVSVHELSAKVSDSSQGRVSYTQALDDVKYLQGMGLIEVIKISDGAPMARITQEGREAHSRSDG